MRDRDSSQSMKDITIIYYTANRISEFFLKNVQEHLIKASLGIPIISVSRTPMDFGENICVDGIDVSLHSAYKQILIGAQKVKTKYMACCEDDTLYVPEHFDFQPLNGSFCYNTNHWHLCVHGFYYRGHRVMSQCVTSTELMIKTLEERFEKYPGSRSQPRRVSESLEKERSGLD